MKDIVTWCVMRSPKDVGYADTFSALDMHANSYYRKVLLKHTNYTEEELTELTFEDLVTVNPDQQYVILLAHMLAIGIENLSERQAYKYITWMLDDSEQYGCGLIAWVLNNSLFNDRLTYPAHAIVCDMLPEGCTITTLRLLWRLACNGDPSTINTIRVVHQYTGTKWYMLLIAYYYLCSGIEDDYLNYFFSDVHRIHEEDRDLCIYLSTLYVWERESLRELVKRNYTIQAVFKVLKHLGPYGFKEPEIIPEIHWFPKRVSTNTRYSEFKFIKGLPELPAMYVPNQHVWNLDVPATTNCLNINKPKDLYKKWFHELSDYQIQKFKDTDEKAYTACYNDDFESATVVLNSLMYNLY